jgi:hypothetical protein
MRTRERFIVIAMILVGAIGLVGCDSKPASTAPVTRANPKAERVLGLFSKVEGTTYLLAGIFAKEEGGFLKGIENGGYGSGSGYSSAVNNYVFFNTADDSTHRLLPHNDSLILRAQRFPDKDKADWFVYDVVKSDTNDDKELSSKDRFTIAMSDGGGNGYSELIPSVETRLGDTLTDGNTLLILYVKDSKKYYSRIDLPNRKVTATNELPSLGNDVK